MSALWVMGNTVITVWLITARVFLSMCYVLADYYGRKVGYALMNAAFEKLSAYSKIAVWVLKGNERAIRFYERYGFKFDGMEHEIMLGTPNIELRMIFERG